MKMHDGEVDIDLNLVRRLVAHQFPTLADLPITAIQSTGTEDGPEPSGQTELSGGSGG